MTMLLQRFTVGPLQENCYLIADPGTEDAVLIDPGDEAERLLSAVRKESLTLNAIWLTHAHFDHVGAVADIIEETGVPLFMHPADEPILHNAAAAAARWDIPLKQPPTLYTPLEDDQPLTLGDLTLKTLLTPGHAPGHVAFYYEPDALVLSGDALFRGSIGRTDLPFGNHEELLRSIKTRLLTLPDDTKVYPGHGPETVIGQEAKTNPFLV